MKTSDGERDFLRAILRTKHSMFVLCLAIGCLVVVAGHKVTGIVTVADLLALLGRGVDRPAARPRRPLNHRTPHRKAHGVVSAW